MQFHGRQMDCSIGSLCHVVQPASPPTATMVGITDPTLFLLPTANRRPHSRRRGRDRRNRNRISVVYCPLSYTKIPSSLSPGTPLATLFLVTSFGLSITDLLIPDGCELAQVHQVAGGSDQWHRLQCVGTLEILEHGLISLGAELLTSFRWEKL